MIDRIKQMLPDDSEVHAIRRQSSKLRRKLERNADGLRSQAHELMDWKHYVRAHPWAAVGAAVAVGYFLVPRRSPIVNVADLVQATPMEPMFTQPIPEPIPVAPPEPPPEPPSMIETVGEALLQSALAFAGQRVLMRLWDHAEGLIAPPKQRSVDDGHDTV